ncbi:MAG: response regulator transcription factor [Chitinophagaceae bacterium]|nr:response regulator transcription factor [Chitinophagaceae bacterium]
MPDLMKSTSEIKILIVEDEPIIARNISMYLDNNDFKVSGIAYDDEEAFAELKNNTPDAVILDINLNSPSDGIDIAAFINKNFHLPFLFLTSYSDRETIQRAKLVEPSGYIVKPFNERTLLASLEIALSNFAQRSNQQAPELKMDKINRHLLSPLTEREYIVVNHIYNGKTNNQVAAAMFVSLNTIKVHIKNAYLKLDASSRTMAVVRLRELMKK